MIQIETKSSLPLTIGRRIKFEYAATGKDAITQLKKGDIGVIRDISPLPKGKNRLISIDWSNGSSLP